MTTIDIEIFVRLGTMERKVFLPDLADALETSQALVRKNLLGLFCHPSRPVDSSSSMPVDNSRKSSEGEPTEGENVNVQENIFILNVPNVGNGGGLGEENPGSVDIATRLSSMLNDSKSLRFFHKLTALVAPEVLEEALRITLAVPEASIHRSRGAYFTALVRSLARRGAVSVGEGSVEVTRS